LKNLLLCFGNGGHKAQAFRIQKTLESKFNDIQYFSVTDVGDSPFWSSAHLELGEARDKISGRLISIPKLFSAFKSVRRFIALNNISTIVSTGPGMSVLVFICAKLRGCAFIHIETWSKFETLTITTRLLNALNCPIWYQNKELRHLLPNGKYVGRL